MKKNFQKMLVFVVLLISLWANAISASATQLTVTADTARIRAEADTSSEVLGSTQRGKTFPAEGEVKDASGMLWYKVSVGNGAYGYIRSDTVEATGTGAASGNDATSVETTGETGGETAEPPATVPTAIGEQMATISQSNVVIRSGASTSHSRITSLPNGTEITLIGEATDGSNKLWYQMKCNYDNREITGYVRSDLITIGASSGDGGAEEQPEEPETEGDPSEGEGDESEPGDEPPAEPPADTPSEPAPQDSPYEVKYEANDVGEYEYYLYDYNGGNKHNIPQLIELIGEVGNRDQMYQDQVRNGRVIIIILAVVIVILALIVTVLFFKLRDMYDDYDEDDEEDYTPPRGQPPAGRMNREGDRGAGAPRSAQRPARPAPDHQGRPLPQRQQQPSSRQQSDGRRPGRPGNPELHAAERTNQPGRPANRPVNHPNRAMKPQNFINDDDEFEFEFLNMDDKDL